MFFFKQKTAYEMRISDWSSDVCSSDFLRHRLAGLVGLDRCISDKWPLRLGAADRRERAVAPVLVLAQVHVEAGDEVAAKRGRGELHRQIVRIGLRWCQFGGHDQRLLGTEIGRAHV